MIKVGYRSGKCNVPGSVFVAELNRCILSLTSVGEINRIMPASVAHDLRCVGQPPGYRYDTPAPPLMRGGPPGIAHHVCGSRPF